MAIMPFHLAIPVDDINAAEHFYGSVLGCEKGRSSLQWIDWNFMGHQLVTHLVTHMPTMPPANNVDDKSVPVPHFGVVLNFDDWHALVARISNHHVPFIIEPYVRFKGKTGEQGTFFLKDPAGNALEFKAFASIAQLFVTD